MWAEEVDPAVIREAFPNRSYTALTCRASALGVARPKDHKQRGDPVIEQLPPNFLAWLAGFIDGEGTIGLYKRKNNDGLEPLLSIANTCFPALLHIHDKIQGGSIQKKSHKGVNEFQGYSYRLHQRRKLAALLPLLLPHLVIKQQNAEILIQFLSEDLNDSVTPERRDYFLRAFRVMNMRGDNAVTTDPYDKDFDEYRRSR